MLEYRQVSCEMYLVHTLKLLPLLQIFIFLMSQRKQRVSLSPLKARQYYFFGSGLDPHIYE